MHLGRPTGTLPENFTALVQQWESKTLPLEALLRECGISETTFYRRLRDLRQSKK